MFWENRLPKISVDGLAFIVKGTAMAVIDGIGNDDIVTIRG